MERGERKGEEGSNHLYPYNMGGGTSSYTERNISRESSLPPKWHNQLAIIKSSQRTTSPRLELSTIDDAFQMSHWPCSSNWEIRTTISC